MPVKCLVFDCDGVILDSVPVKTAAFGRLAESYGQEARDRFVAYHTEHGGVSRYRKFAWFFQEVLGRPITEAESSAWGEKFAEYALDEVRKCRLIPGAMQTLQEWHGRLPMYVCSGTPTEELRAVLEERDLARFFDGIFGSPPGKREVLAEIIRSQPDLLAGQALMIGDSITDQHAAEHAGSLFYAVGPELEGEFKPWSADLEPLNAWICAHA